MHVAVNYVPTGHSLYLDWTNYVKKNGPEVAPIPKTAKANGALQFESAKMEDEPKEDSSD
eukprot:1619560-Pleurochrysis_carterae.AAC.3